MENTMQNTSPLHSTFFMLAKQYGLSCEIKKNKNTELWLGRKVFEVPFYWGWNMQDIQSSIGIFSVISNASQNLQLFEKSQADKKDNLIFEQDDECIKLTMEVSQNKTMVVSMSVFQNKKIFKRRLKAFDNREKYRLFFSLDTGISQIDNFPRINDFLFCDFFHALLNKGQSESRFKINGTKIFVSKDLKEVSVVLEKIGQGACNAVYKVFDLLKKEKRALRKTHMEYKSPIKKIIFKQYSLAVAAMKSGFEILQELNKNGPVPGIPSASKQITLFEDKEGKVKSFISVDLASYDLFEMIFEHDGRNFFGMELKQQLHFLKAIIEGLAFSHKLGIAHLDIKAENILVKLNDKNEPESVSINDWDGARRGPKHTLPTLTPCYCPSSIYENQMFSVEEMKRCDVFALCLTFLEVLTRTEIALETERLDDEKFAKFFDENSKEKQKKILNNLKTIPLIDENGKRNSKGVTLPENLINLLVKGLCSDAPSIDVLLEEYEDILKNL